MKKKLYINACRLFSLLAIVTLFVACDAHRDFPDTAMKPCHILCTDGKVLSVSDFKQSEKQPIAVVFHVNHDEAIEGNGYAVYLWDLAPEAFADSIGVSQRTSADITALDGNENTFAIYDTRETTSPMAEAVFALWRYGQSSYIPSVAQMRMLYICNAPILIIVYGFRNTLRANDRGRSPPNGLWLPLPDGTPTRCAGHIFPCASSPPTAP